MRRESVLRSTLMAVLIPLVLSASSSSENTSVDALAKCLNHSQEVYLFASAMAGSDKDKPKSPLSMVLPEDSEVSIRSRRRRHVICGRKKKRGGSTRLSFEQRSVCPFSHYKNIDVNRIPVLLEEVRCLCDRPSHVSSYSEIRCQPLVYRMPVLIKNQRSGLFIQSAEDLTLACIPIKPREESVGKDLLVPIRAEVEND